jgi:hypothetical protein
MQQGRQHIDCVHVVIANEVVKEPNKGICIPYYLGQALIATTLTYPKHYLLRRHSCAIQTKSEFHLKRM